MPNPDTHSWNTMISGYAQMGNLELACDFFERMPQKNLVSWNSVIAGCERNEDYKGAIELFSQMQVEVEKPDRHTLSNYIYGRERVQGFNSMSSIRLSGALGLSQHG
ncbi:hypothetical protein Patl1_35891 [Pistacia atlantica]|nr:hypothetical protein Patl1_35891 [Pistacia atlantica]